jgi:hypothetical protein
VTWCATGHDDAASPSPAATYWRAWWAPRPVPVVGLWSSAVGTRDVGAAVVSASSPGRPAPPCSAATLGTVDEIQARHVVDALRDRGIGAHLAKAGVYSFGVRVALSDGREAIWDSDGTAGLEAEVMRDGVLVGFVPVIEASEDFDEQQIVDAIARTDYDEPVAHQRSAVPPSAAPLPREGGLFRRFLDGFRYR